MPRRLVTNWGNYPVVSANFSEPSEIAGFQESIRSSNEIIARGNGRCYGDSSLAENIVSTLKLNRFLAFDPAEGTLECESGVLLSEILEVIVPKGFFLPVTPGTKFITLGGAIAADVHGKNHHREGSFSDHLISLRILTPDASIEFCSPEDNPELFWQTCGAMGLTGVILSAKFRLKPIETSYIRQTARKALDLEAVMRLFDESGSCSYSVAWTDCLARGKSLGRSIVNLGDHVLRDELPEKLRRSPLIGSRGVMLQLPLFLPGFSLNYATVKMFNTAYFHRQFAAERESILHYDPFFYPLDGVLHWNRAYGRRGFVQYQFVLPKAGSFDGLKEILTRIERSGQGSPLAVLKLFGKQSANAVMSFPREGYTLALDFKATPAVFKLLDELDEIVLKHGGRIYLAKDARMSADVFHRSYPSIVRSNRFRSAQAARLKF